MRVIVSGSAGFIGKHTVKALEDRGDTVIGLDKVTGTDLAEPIEAWNPKPDAIIHLAGSSSTPGSLTDPMGTFRDTVLTAVNVIEAARQDRIPMLITSSVKAREGWTPYGAAKVMVEKWANEMEAAYRIPMVINRPGTVYGPGQEGSPESGWIAWFVKARDEGFPIVINDDGSQVRDLLHVADYVRLQLIQLDELVEQRFGSEYHEKTWDVGGGILNAVSVYDMAIHLGLAFSFGPHRRGDASEYIGVNDVPGWQPIVHWRDSETLKERSEQNRYTHV